MSAAEITRHKKLGRGAVPAVALMRRVVAVTKAVDREGEAERKGKR